MTSNDPVLLKTDIPYLKLHNKGKVREIFEIDDNLLLVATDRISAFDYILPNGIPHKGKVLTLMSEFWFKLTRELTENHLITMNIDEIDKIAKEDKDLLRGRSMLVKKVEVIPVECIVRGYLAGSGWKEYKENGTVCKINLPDNLKESELSCLSPSSRHQQKQNPDMTKISLSRKPSRLQGENSQKR